MGTIIKQSADGIVLSRDNNFDTNLGKVFINNHEITNMDTFFKVAEENTRLLEQVKKQKEVIDKLKITIKNDMDGFMTINEHGESESILELLEIYLEILEDKEVSE